MIRQWYPLPAIPTALRAGWTIVYATQAAAVPGRPAGVVMEMTRAVEKKGLTGSARSGIRDEDRGGFDGLDTEAIYPTERIGKTAVPNAIGAAHE